MGEVGEKVVVKCVEKKKQHKKRKHGELGDLGGADVRDVQLDRKKSKSEGLSGDCVSQVVVDVGVGVSEDKRSRKEKKKEKSRLIKSGDQNIFEKMKAKKSEGGVEGGDSRGKEASDGMDGEEGDGKSTNDNMSDDCLSQVVVDVEVGASEDKRSRKEKKKEKSRLKSGDQNIFEKMKAKKSRSGVEGGNPRGKEVSDRMDGEEGDGKSMNDNVSSGVMGSEVGGAVIEKVKLKKDKKEKKKKSKSEPKSIEDGDTSRSDIGGHAGSVEKQIGHQVNENVDLVDNKKQKKKASGINEEEGPVKYDELINEVTDQDELIEGRKKKKKEKNKEKHPGAGFLDKNISGEALLHSENHESREATGHAGLVEDQMKNEEGDGKSMNDNVSSGVMGSEVGGAVIEKVKLKKDKKEKKKKSKSETKSIEDGDTSRSDIGGHAGSVEKQIGHQVNEKVDLVDNKKQKKKVSGVNEEEGPLKYDELINEVTDQDELIKKNKKKNKEKHPGAGFFDKNISGEALLHSESHESREATGHAGLVEDQMKNEASKKRKKKRLAINTEDNAAAGVSATDEGNEPTAPGEKSNPGKKSGRVRFSDSVEVFSLPDKSSEEEDNVVGEDQGMENFVDGDGLVRGKRFSKEEDEIIRKAVWKYIEDRQLGEEGLQMVLKCRKHKEVRDCWDVIMEDLSWRTKQSVYSRAHILFERSESRKWTKEDLEVVRKYHEKHGPKWRELADEMGRNRIHVKDAFRQIRLVNKRNGPWSQEEYQTLFDSVNISLRLRASMDRKSQHGMLRDNIGWEAVSQKIGTRTDPICCMKWYDQLTSALVKSGVWADTDDHRLLMALVDIDATCEEEVDWDNILEHRPGDVCRKRWNQMVRHIGEHGTKSFSEQVEILHQRYVPDVLEARETYESKPFVD